MEVLGQRERLLELLYMTVCHLLSARDKRTLNKYLLELSKIVEALRVEPEASQAFLDSPIFVYYLNVN